MKIFLLLFLAIFSSCDNTPSTGGVENTPNFVKGKSSSNSTVTLKNISVSTTGEVLNYKFETISTTDGSFEFTNIGKGDFVISVDDSSKKALVPRLKINNNDSIDIGFVKSNNTVIIKGRVLKSNCEVFIPGTEIHTPTDADGIFSLPNCPIGTYDICFSSPLGIANLPVTILYTSDTVFIRDVNLQEKSATSYSPYESSVASNYAIIPVQYHQDSLPTWYINKNFNFATYDIPDEGAYYTSLTTEGEKIVMVDDFQDNVNISSSLQYILFSKWYNSVNDSSTSSISFDSEGDNKYITMNSTHNTISSYSLIGLFLKNKITDHIDLSKLTKIEFKAKGNVEVSFSLESPIFDTKHDESYKQPSITFMPTPEWKTFSFSVDSIQSFNGLTWNDVKTEINRMEFTVKLRETGDFTLSVDDIKLYGVTILDLKN